MIRDAFEKWIVDYSYGTLPLERDAEGYEDFDVQKHWISWNAAQIHWKAYKPGDNVPRGLYLVTHKSGYVTCRTFVAGMWLYGVASDPVIGYADRPQGMEVDRG